MKALLKGGRVIDPSKGIDGQRDVVIEKGIVTQIDRDLVVSNEVQVVEVPPSCVICPGFIDPHVHLREPGQEHKETVATGSAAAVAGGFTAVACMPNTNPINDNAGVTEFILKKADEADLARVYPIGAVSIKSNGEQLAEIAELKSAGCVAISDDGRPVATALLMRRAQEYANMFGMAVIDHCEVHSLSGDGVVNEGHQAALAGLHGIPSAAEEIMVERDVTLAGMTGAAVHIAHLSSAGSLRAVASGKERKIRVTCEVTPHHFTLTDESVASYDTNFKMKPPLQESEDRQALIQGLKDGTVDMIATDHAPHHYDEKSMEFDRAPFGIVGLETAVSITLDRLVHTGVIGLSRLVELMAVNPALVLGVVGGTIEVGAPADLTILAPDLAVTVKASAFRSKSKNTPFDGWKLHGGVAGTIVGGRSMFINEDVSGMDVFKVLRREG